MQSTIIHVRLKPEELFLLDAICQSKGNPTRNRSEMLRLLIHRESSRRTTGRSVVPDRQVSTDWRNGRPKGPTPISPAARR